MITPPVWSGHHAAHRIRASRREYNTPRHRWRHRLRHRRRPYAPPMPPRRGARQAMASGAQTARAPTSASVRAVAHSPASGSAGRTPDRVCRGRGRVVDHDRLPQGLGDVACRGLGEVEFVPRHDQRQPRCARPTAQLETTLVNQVRDYAAHATEAHPAVRSQELFRTSANRNSRP